MDSKRSLPLWKKLVFSIILTVLLFSLLEGILRMAGFGFVPPKSSRERIWGKKGVQQDPTLPWSWTPIPGASCFIAGNPEFQFNERGFRGDVFQDQTTEKHFRIVCMGDSCTLGWDVADQKTFCFQLRHFLQSKIRKKVETINAGVMGYTSFQGLHQLRTRVLELHPDLIVVSYNWNDHSPAISLRGMEYTSESQPDNELPKTDSMYRMAENLSSLRSFQLVQWILSSATDRVDSQPSAAEEDPEFELTAIPQKLRVPLPYFTQNLAEIIDTAKEKGIQLVLMTQPYQPPRQSDSYKQFFVDKQEEYNAAMQKVAERKQVPFIDMKPVFESAGTPGQLFVSRVHPTERGHRAIAEALADKIASLSEMQDYRK